MLRRLVRISRLTSGSLFSVYARYTRDSGTGTETSDIVESRVFTDVDVVFSCFCFVRSVCRTSFRVNKFRYVLPLPTYRCTISIYLFITIINNNKPLFPYLILSSFEARSFRSNIYNEIFQFVNSDSYSRASQTIFLFTRTISFQFVRSTMILFLSASRLTNRFNRAGILWMRNGAKRSS